MIYLFTVAAPARSGTQWFSRLFTMEHAFCYHELTTLLQPYPSNEALHQWLRAQTADHDFEQMQRRWLLQCYPTYFARFWERANFGQHIVGNSDHFILEYLPALWLLWPEMKFIFSVRNGINCVQSHYTHYRHFPDPVLTPMEAEDGTADFFVQSCHLWADEVAAQERSKQWLTGRAQCIDTTLERVTTDLDELKTIWDWVGFGKWDQHLERNQQMVRTPVNARTNQQSVVSWQKIWNDWTPQQQQTYWSICGETHRKLGYDVPSEAVAAMEEEPSSEATTAG